MASNNHGQGLFDSIGRYPAEYNAKVHGPYNPGRYYGKLDAAFGDVKLGELSAWLGRRSKNPVDVLRVVTRANWRWYQRWMLPRKPSIAGLVQGALVLSGFHYLWQYEVHVNERHAKYHW